jgi:thiosulfate/3-mercaptopyruvate sulfurtransferase
VVSAGWLFQQDWDTGMLVVDARPAADYEQGHLPGSISLPVEETFDPNQSRNYPDTPARLEALLRRKVVADGRRVLVYDAGAQTPAARLFWTLEYLGHQDVAILDGGLKAWQAAGGTLTPEPVSPTPAAFTALVSAGRLHVKRQCDAGLDAGVAKTMLMLDARSPEEYRGEDVRAKYGGHIPGAVNVDWRECFQSDARLKEPAALRALYTGRGVTPDREVVAYCQTGQRSSVSYWTLRLLGYPRVANYAGSWVEWGNDPATPKVTG